MLPSIPFSCWINPAHHAENLRGLASSGFLSFFLCLFSCHLMMALSGCTDCSHPPGSAGTRSQHNAVGARDSSLALPPRGFLNPAVSDCAGGTVSGRCALQRQSSWKMPPISLKEPYVSHPCSVSSLLVPAPHCSHSPGLFFRASSSLAGTSGPLALHFQFLRTYFSPCTFPAP